MPILGHEQPVLFSMGEVFNPTTANMLLQALLNYGNILRLDYKESVLDFKDFNKEFGNFYSAIEADNQRYYDLTLGGLGNLYDAMLKLGVDPLRSMEGRAMLLKYIATRPYGELANIRRSADAAKEYIKNRDALIAQGLYNPKFDEFIYGENDPTLWNTSEKGIWSRTSPEQYKDLNTSTKHWFDNMELSYDEAASKATGGVYDVYTKSEGTMRLILDTRLKDYLSTNIGKFHLAEYGGDAESLKNAIVDANREVIQQKRSMNELYAMERKFAHDIDMFNRQAALNKLKNSGKNSYKNWNVFEAAQNNGGEGQGIVKYNVKDVDMHGIVPDNPGWVITSGTSNGTPYSFFDFKGEGKPEFYDMVPQSGEDKKKYGAVRPKAIQFRADLDKFRSVENAGEIKSYTTKDKNGKKHTTWYNKVFISNFLDGRDRTTWIKIHGSHVPPAPKKNEFKPKHP